MQGKRTLLREKIVEEINEDLEKISIDEKKLAAAHWSPADIVKRPAAVVMPEELESSYSNTLGGRDLVYPFRVFVTETLGNRGQTEVEKELSDIEDYLVGVFNKRNAMKDRGIDGLIAVEPVPSIWGWVEGERGWDRVASVMISCKIKIDST